MPQASQNKLKALSFLMADPEVSLEDKDAKLGEFGSLLGYVTDYIRNEQPVSEESVEVDPISILGMSGVPAEIAQSALKALEELRQ